MELTNKNSINKILHRSNLRLKKRFGQHFLVSRKILHDIISAADLKKGEKILEIGSGIGTLTQELLRHRNKVVAVEIDSQLVQILKNNFKHKKNLEIINDDILRISIPKVDKIIANLPYQITSPTIRKFLNIREPKIKIMVLMVQKEVAERIVAKPKDSKRGFLSVMVQYYGEARIIKIVPKELFWPIPKVDSAIIKINLKSQISNLKIKEEELFKIVQAGFSQKRKKIRNSLAAALHFKPQEIDQILQKMSIDPNLRAEELSIESWKKVSQALEHS